MFRILWITAEATKGMLPADLVASVLRNATERSHGKDAGSVAGGVEMGKKGSEEEEIPSTHEKKGQRVTR